MVTFDSETSPRMRGKPSKISAMVNSIRNIPAYAGKTGAASGGGGGAAKHPRVCGENLPHKRLHLITSETSPRMRGKRVG